MKKFLAVLLAAAMLMGMMAIPALATGEDATFTVNSPADNAVYFDKDVVISITATDEIPIVTFDGVEVDVNAEAFPECTATIPFANHSFGLHEVVIEVEGEEPVKRTVEFCSNIIEPDFKYDCVASGTVRMNEGAYDSRPISAEYGTLEPVAGSDELTDGAFRITKTSGGGAYFNVVNENPAEIATGGSLYSISFDVKRGNEAAAFNLEGKNQDGWAWIGIIEEHGNFINSDGTIDASDTVLPANEWHNLKIVWESKDKGKYWVYLDNTEIFTAASVCNLSYVKNIRFNVREGSLDFDNLTYGKFMFNPRLDSVAYIEDGEELNSSNNLISTGAEKIILNLTEAFSEANSVTVNGARAANVELDGKKLIITPGIALPANEVINIEVGSTSKVSNVALGKSVVYKVKTGATEFSVVSPVDNATYFDKDVEISIISPNGAPTVKFDNVAVSMDASNAPTYTATVQFEDKSLGIHDVVIEVEGEEPVKRTVEFCSNIIEPAFKYVCAEAGKVVMNGGYDSRRIDGGTLEPIAGADGLTDGAFRITKTGGQAYFALANNYDAECATGGSLYSISFDVRRGNEAAAFNLEGKNEGDDWIWIGIIEENGNVINSDGTIDASDTVLPANEWHNLKIVWESKDKGKYWVYLDNTEIFTAASVCNLSNVKIIRFNVREGSLDFDNLTYGKFMFNPRLDSATYDDVTEALDGNVISPLAEKIVLNLTSAYDAGTVSVKVDGEAATAELSGNKLIVTPPAALAENTAYDIEVASSATVSGVALGKSVVYRVETGALDDTLESFMIKGDDSSAIAELKFTHGFGSDNDKLLVTIAAYSGNQLVGIKTGWHTLEIGENEIGTNELTIPSGATVKAFVFGKNMKSIAKAEN